MLCTFNASIWMCCILKTCYTTTKALYFYCKSPASGFHKAVSVYHTWLSNNNVIQQTPPYPEDITQEIGAGQASIRRSLPTLPFLSISLSLSSPSITYTLHYSLDYLGQSNMVCYPCHCCLKLSLSSVLLLSLLSLHLMLTHKSRCTSSNSHLQLQHHASLIWKYERFFKTSQFWLINPPVHFHWSCFWMALESQCHALQLFSSSGISLNPLRRLRRVVFHGASVGLGRTWSESLSVLGWRGFLRS